MTDGHCFISYSNGDADEFGTQLANELEGGNPYIETWYDKRDIPAGATWDEKVPEAIKTCKCFIFVMTNDSVAENTICADEWDLALRYKRPILILRLDKDIKEAPFRLGKRQWIDYVGNPRAGIAKLRLAIQRLDSPEGQIDILRDRLADANRDLVRIQEKDEKSRIESEIKELNEELKATELIKKDPEKARKQTRKNINAGLERDRQPINPVSDKTISKFINPRPGSIPDYFEGRVIETQEIADFLRNDHQRIMTIIGRAGSGKTALTCRVLQRLENEEFPNDLGEFMVGGIVYLSEIGNYKINVPNIFSGLLQLLPIEKANKIDAIYREAKKPIDEKIRALLAELPQVPVVLLLDNFEDLLDSEKEEINDQELHTALVTILQADKHNLKILITTRVVPRQLSIIETARQYIKHLEEGLATPFAENVLKKMDVDGQAGLRDATNELLGKVREATLGYPRALEALYAILRVDRYSNVEELLAEGVPETVVENFVGEAFSRLDITKQKIIQTLAIFNRPVSYAAVDFALQFHIPGISSSSILERLVSMHFVRRESKRYFLHPADRDYALSRIPYGNSDKRKGQGARARSWDKSSLTLRAADYFAEIQKPNTEWKTVDDLIAHLAEFDLRCDAEDYNAAIKVLRKIDFDYLLLWGHYRLIIQMHEKVEGKLSENMLLMHNLNGLGLAHKQLGNLRKSITYFEKGITIARESKNHQAEGTFLGNLGAANATLGNSQKAIELYEQGLVIARKLGDRRSEGIDLHNLGNCYADLGNLQKSIEFYEKALVIAQNTHDKKNEGLYTGSIGGSYLRLGDLGKSIDFYKRALAIAYEIGDRGNEGSVLANMGAVNSKRGNMNDAIKLNEQALVIAREIGDRILEGTTLLNLGHGFATFGDFKKSHETFEKTLAIHRDTGDRKGESVTLYNIGSNFFELEEYQKAKDYFLQAINFADEILYQIGQSKSRFGLAQTYLAQNQLDDAETTIEAALGYDVPQNNHNATTLHGIIALRQGEKETAQEAFAKSIVQADEILAKTPDYYSALDAKGLALCGLALCARDDGQSSMVDGQSSMVNRQQAIETFKQARKIAPHAGIVKSVLRLFDELMKCEGGEILKDVRNAVEGVE